MSQGVWPWLRSFVTQLAIGHPERPSAASFDHVLARLADADAQFDLRLRRAALPEMIRQELQERAVRLRAACERSLAHHEVTLEAMALEAAAECGDACARLDATPDERRALATACELLLLEAVGRAPRPTSEPNDKETSDERLEATDERQGAVGTGSAIA
jgi:hypothetical protein